MAAANLNAARLRHSFYASCQLNYHFRHVKHVPKQTPNNFFLSTPFQKTPSKTTLSLLPERQKKAKSHSQCQK
jgi:hypothetical protein